MDEEVYNKMLRRGKKRVLFNGGRPSVIEMASKIF
jgi:hypothetical protein